MFHGKITIFHGKTHEMSQSPWPLTTVAFGDSPGLQFSIGLQVQPRHDEAPRRDHGGDRTRDDRDDGTKPGDGPGVMRSCVSIWNQWDIKIFFHG